MLVIAIFGALLLVGVLVSEATERSVLSTAVLFLVGGFVCGEHMLGLMTVDPKGAVVAWFVQITLFAVLYTDGMRLRLIELRAVWKLPGRALLFGMPLTLLSTAVLAYWLIGLSWLDAFLIAAVLSPTDPVFAAAIVGRQNVPAKLRHLLNVESGLNDGLALPLVVVLLAMNTRKDIHPGWLAAEIVAGVGLGLVIPLVASRLERLSVFGVAERFRPMFTISVGMLLFAIANLTHANLYLAGFTGGMALNNFRPQTAVEFEEIGVRLTELLKLASLLLLGALISPLWMANLGIGGIAFILLALLITRPIALLLALLGSRLSMKERLVAGWFGPRGFAAVVYGILVLKSSEQTGPQLFHLIALVVGGSILAHSSTDVLIARWFENEAEEEETGEESKGQTVA